MVGIAAKTKDADYERSSANNPIIKYMLKAREQHAGQQRHDYSHVFRRKTRCEMIRLSVIAMAIELAYAAETSFVSPILLQIGIDHKLMTMAWGFSPLIGFFISPLLGSISDRCTLSWGRRRPIMTILSVGIVFGLILVPHGREIGLLFGDVGYNVTSSLALGNYSGLEGVVEALQSPLESSESPLAGNFKYAAILTIIGMIMLDLNADTCQTPARTYMLDMCTPEDQARGLTTFTLLAGVGGCVGYAIGGINWEQTSLGIFMGGNIPTVFTIVTISFIACFLVTITTFREIPLKLIERDNMLKPLSDTEIHKEMLKNNNSVYYIKQTTAMENQMNDSELHGKYSVVVSMESHHNDAFVADAHDGLAAATSKAAELSNGNAKAAELPDDTPHESPITLKQYLKSIFVMPSSMRTLSLTNLFCWMSHVIYCLYFTDFVGEAVFHGDPAAPPNSEAANLYEEGVRFGCWGMAIYALSCSIYSMTVTKLMKWFGPRVVYIVGILYYGIGMLVLGIWPTKWGVLVFSTSAGILYGTLFTMPYILVARYHSKNCFNVQNGETIPLKQTRGLGTDVAIISSMVFIAQLIVSLSVGPLVSWMQTTCAILYASSILAFIAAVFAMFVLYV